MPQPNPSDPRSAGQFMNRLDRTLGNINPLLVAIAIGLAALDVTCFLAIKASNEIQRRPPIETATPAQAAETTSTAAVHHR